ncbi:universal stress protein [Candidatus Nitrosocosmicus arcticus]|nr:universal stress protein [Candidatus Nitrosocosmicus arcticus]
MGQNLQWMQGRTGLKKMLGGSTASEVVKYAHCPVLIVR